MKKQHCHFFTFLLLVVYFVFSSGIAITVHHCCDHCREYVAQQCCEDHGDEESCEIPNAEKSDSHHHHAHDKYYFFKIKDFYKASQSVIPAHWQWIQVGEEAFLTQFFSNLSLEKRLKENIFIPSFFHLQGDRLLDFLHQRVYYA